ncbi:hypothetical protein ACFQQB_38445 [Nonomuraea rubra]|uniref:hypothetical protein n=1 Tax=Nonomuraea rubra TaxID=46180 RepID=UPI0036113D8C
MRSIGANARSASWIPSECASRTPPNSTSPCLIDRVEGVSGLGAPWSSISSTVNREVCPLSRSTSVAKEPEAFNGIRPVVNGGRPAGLLRITE